MKKLFSIFALLTLSAGLWAIDGVKYIDANGVEQTASGVTEVTDTTTTLSGWCVVLGDNVTTGTLTCSGAVHLILADGAKLTVNAASQKAGIQVSDPNSIAIYAQSAGDRMGQLIATGGEDGAGIGGGLYQNGSNITINGGIVTATGGDDGAGIGGGDTGNGSHITINGGIIGASGQFAAGIGGGWRGTGSDITINGGTVTAKGGTYGAGIGGGVYQNGSNITINGGTIIAINAEYAAGIGGGAFGNGSNITINGGTVTATGGQDAAAIGSGEGGTGSNIYVATDLVVKAGASANPTDVIAPTRTATTDIASDLAGKQYATVGPKPAKDDLTASDFEVSNNSVTYNGEAKAAIVALKSAITGAGAITVTYKQSGEELTPLNAGEYDIYAAVAEGTAYNAFAAAKVGTLTITKATLIAADFTFAAPEDLTWDGNAKNATVTFDAQSGKLIGCGNVTIKYNGEAQAPSAAGDYAVSIDVAEGANFAAATALTKEDWKFTIVEPTPKVGDQFTDATSGLKFEVTSLDPKTVKVIANGYSGKNYTVPASVTYLAETFNVTEIGDQAFLNCGELTAIVIPAAVTTIGTSAFEECDGLQSITCLATTPPACDDYCFMYVSTSIPLYVPEGTAELYGNANEWKEFMIIDPATSYTREGLSNGKFGTVCLPYASASLTGAKFYSLNYYDASAGNLYLEEVSALEAGKPYIFEASAESFTVTYAAVGKENYVAAAANVNGLYGTYKNIEVLSDGNMAAISNNQVNIAANGVSFVVPACRAYIDMDQVPDSEQPHAAPLRRIGVPRQTPTNNESVNASVNANGKYIINGRLVIIKEGKEYNVLGM